MRYVSTFSGIEAASVAWEPLGWEPMAFAEVDPFPSAVLAHRYPDVPNLGDVTKINWKEFVSESGRPDVLVGGSPCQSFSIAGGRESLAGQSSLMYEYIRACAEIRSPWIVWENVPGVFSVRDDAFAQLVCALQDVGYVSLAWRVLDAQFFGVAQRRRRVFLVGHLGDGGGAAAVLFERESVRGNTQTGREKRASLAADARKGAEGAGEGCMTPWDTQGRRVYGDSGAHPTLDARAVPRRTYAFKYAQGSKARTMPTYDDGSCNTLTADWHAPAVAYEQEVVAMASNAANAECETGDMAPAVIAHAGKEAPFVVLKVRGGADTYVKRDGSIGTAGKGALLGEEAAFTIAATQDQTLFQPSKDGYVVRRITPTECERLQGFPDGWTDVPYKGKDHPADGARYKSIGNSMAVPVMRWIGERIEMVQAIEDAGGVRKIPSETAPTYAIL